MRVIKKAFIEITNQCNLACPFCPGTKRQKAFMEAEAFEAILAKLVGNVRFLYFHVLGEPLLHPLLGQFLDRAQAAGLPVNLTTNGTLLGAVGDMLVQKPALRQVNISLHSQADSNSNAEYLESVLAFARKARAESPILISLRLWNEQGGGAPENEWILHCLAQEFGVDRAGLDELPDLRGLQLDKGLYLHRAELFIWPSLSQPEIGTKGFCMGLRDQVGILCDGTVIPCCLDSEGAVALGNISRQTLPEILDSPRAKAIYDNFSNREASEELCRKCGFRERFGI
jgi:radical SAM protein with 4Fe4S-binding SPASM domain